MILDNALSNLTLLTLAMGLFGLCLGSFLNVVIYRLPIMIDNQTLEESTLKPLSSPTKINLCFPASFCPHCRKNIPYRFNIPILGFLLLKGKSNCCGQKVSPQYLWVELVTSILMMVLTLHFGYTFKLFAAVLFCLAAIVLFFIDMNEQILPDSITIPFLWLGLLFNIFALFTELPSAVLGSVSGYLCFFVIAACYKLIRKVEGIGQGDFKLFALLGAWFGWQSLPTIAAAASACCLAFAVLLMMFKKMNYDTPIPFGPFLILAGLVILMFQ